MAQAAPLTLRFLEMSGISHGRQVLDGLAEARPDLVAAVEVRTAPTADVEGPFRESVEAGSPSADLVLTNLAGALAGASLGLWQPTITLVQPLLPPMDELLVPLARILRGVVRDQVQVISASHGGPLLTYAPERVAQAPRTAEDLLAWARENPGRFLYPRPDFSQAGRSFVCGLPWMLHDSDPTDPQRGWPLTWEYLAELDRHIPYYPTTTLAAFQELSEGGADMTVTTVGADTAFRAFGLVPLDMGLEPLHDMRWVPDGLFLCMPRNLPTDRIPALVQAIAHALGEARQAEAYGRGGMWPGPVRQGISLDMAPAGMQAELRRVVRPTLPAIIADHPFATPLLMEDWQKMLTRWDDEISAWHGVRP